MADIYTKGKRSWVMSRVNAKNTKPELIVRKFIYSMGYRYRLHDKKLPGKPDLVFPGRKKVIFIHGCFWHGHGGCKKSKRPSSNNEFWNHKIDQTITRDKINILDLKNLGWQVLTIWECELKNLVLLKIRIQDFLS